MLNLYERVWERMEVDGSELRWRIEHAQHILPEDVPRFGELGIIASVQAVHGTSDGPWIPTRLGDEHQSAAALMVEPEGPLPVSIQHAFDAIDRLAGPTCRDEIGRIAHVHVRGLVIGHAERP